MQRLLILFATFCTFFVSLSIAQDMAQSKQPEGTNPTSSRNKPVEWEPSSTRSIVVDNDPTYNEVIVNIFFSPLNAVGLGTKDNLERLFVGQDVVRDWGFLFGSIPLTSSEERLSAFISYCDGATNFADACNGDVFIKVIRRSKDGKWDYTWNRTSPFVRLRADLPLEVLRERAKGFFMKAFPNHPKAKAAAKKDN